MLRRVFMVGIGAATLGLMSTAAQARPDLPLDLMGSYSDGVSTYSVDLFLRGNGTGTMLAGSSIGASAHSVDWGYDNSTNLLTVDYVDAAGTAVSVTGTRVGSSFEGAYYLDGAFQGDFEASTACEVQMGTAYIRDCNGSCAPVTWLGDGLCDDGVYSSNLIPIFFDDETCELNGNAWTFGNDKNDCAPVFGCTDPTATNYTYGATDDDGSCTYPPTGCVVVNPGYLGDGYCDTLDPAYNSEVCGWDGGDCCESTCVSATFECGVSTAYTCLDPGA
jgi:hypothetical protein